MHSQKGLLSRIYAQIPKSLRERTGEQTYEAYIAVRRRLVGAQVKVAYGRREISYLEIDRGHAGTVLFLHGFADSKDNFFDACHYLARDFNVICPDLPGFGRSSKLKDDTYSLSNYSDWLIDFADTIGLKSFHLAGNSLGGAVSAQMAIRYGHRLSSLILVNPAGVLYSERYSLHHELFSGHTIFDIQNRSQFEYFLHRVYYRKILLPAIVKDHLYQEFRRHSRWHRKLLRDLFEGIESVDDPKVDEIALNLRLPEIKVPTLILWGDEDTLFPYQTAYLMKELIPHAKLHFFTDTGHCPQVEDPRMFARVVKKFLNEIDGDFIAGAEPKQILAHSGESKLKSSGTKNLNKTSAAKNLKKSQNKTTNNGSLQKKKQSSQTQAVKSNGGMTKRKKTTKAPAVKTVGRPKKQPKLAKVTSAKTK